MQSPKPDSGGGTQTSALPHATGDPVGLHARAFVVHVAGGTVGVSVDAPHVPPVAVGAETLTEAND
jgi:hypothetical protein